MTASRSFRRRFTLHILFVFFFVLICAVLYMQGMAKFEGSQRGFWQSLEIVVETLTGTGYGADAGWDHPLMILLMITLQLSGLTLLFSFFPLYMVPFFEARFEQRLPVEAPAMEGHFIIFRHSGAVSAVLGELEKADRPVLVVEEDEQEARRLHELGHKVIHRDLDDEGLLAAGLLRARTLIANGSDGENVTLALSARQLGFRGQIMALVGDGSYSEVMLAAGCDEVLAPRDLLAVALAARASERVSPTLAGAHQLGDRLEIFQIRVQPDSRIAGQDLAKADIGARTGMVVIGQWVGGELNSDPGPDMVIQPGGILVVAGSHDGIERMIRLEAGTRPIASSGHLIVVGNGEVGSQVIELLRDAGEKVMVIDRKDGPGVDLVGDIIDPVLIARASLEVAQGIILAIDSDVSTLFATVFLHDQCYGVPILARVNESENLEKIHRAGADFALSFSQVASSLMAERLLGRQTLELNPQLKLLKASGEALAGRHPSELKIRSRTGCSIVAVERGENLLTSLDGDFRFEADDGVYICGGQEAVDRFESQFML